MTRSLLAALPLLVMLFGSAAAEEVRLTVLHTTDLHGALTGYDYLADAPAARGLTRVATLVRRVRDEGAPVLLLDAGDCIQGSPLATVYRNSPGDLPDPMMRAMTEIGYDAMAVGNHEFDFGLATVEKSRADAGFPWLAANVVRVRDGKPAFPASLVKTLGGIRVGVVGVCTPAVPRWLDSLHYEGLRFESPVTAARAEVEKLRNQERCDLVVLVAHSGLERAEGSADPHSDEPPDENWGRRLAAEVPGLDVLVLGHTHVTIPSSMLGGVIASQAGKWGEHLGRVDVTLSRDGPDARWRVVNRRARAIAVTDTTPEDGARVAFARPYHERAQAALEEVLGHAARDLASPRGRLDDGPLWELIHHAQLEASGAEVSLAALFEPRAAIRRGPITLRDVMKLYPYENTLGVVELSGAEIEETLEHSAGYFAPYTYEKGRPLAAPGRQGFNFDTCEGLTYEIDLLKPVGDRVQHLAIDGQPLDPARRLRVAVNSYRMNGGGNYEALRRAPRLWRSQGGVRELIADRIRDRDTLDNRFERNWTLLPDYVAIAERPLIDRLVRLGAIPAADVHRLYPDEPARRGDVAYWLARSFDWRERRRFSGAFADLPDSLEPWLDGLLKRRVLGSAGASEHFDPFAIAPLSLVLDWSENAARAQNYALSSRLGDREFRLGLVSGVDLGGPRPGAFAYRDTLSRGQVLGILSNLRFPSLRVLETTDFHGAMQPRTRERDSGRAWGGSAVLVAHLERLRAENPHGTLLLDGGDMFQGTMASNLAFGRPVVEQMNALGYAAAAIGNHEFDWSADTLVRRIREMRFAALGANIVERKSGRRPRWAGSDTVVTRRGLRIGIFGMSYRFTPSVTLPRHVAHLRFEDDSATAARIVPRLRKGGLDAVIGLGHVPASEDTAGRVRGDLVRMARGIPGVDLWVGGHSHNRVEGDVNGIPVLVPGSHGELIAVCDLVVDPVRHRVMEREYRLEPTYADLVKPDSATLARVAAWAARIEQVASEPIGRNPRRLKRSGSENLVGYLVTDAMRDAVGADIAMQNAGGIRADLPEGTVTRGTIYEVMPFDNTIVTLTLTGAQVGEVLEAALSRGRVTPVSGLRYEYSTHSAEPRVFSLRHPDGTPLDEKRRYKVAVNNFMAEGGDDLNILANASDKQDTGLLVREQIEAFVRKVCSGDKALDYKPEGRMVRSGSPSSGR